MITIFVLSWILAVTTFILGFYLGKGSFTKQTYEAIKKGVDHRILPQYKQPSGVIQRPDAKRIYELNHPEILAEKEEMKKTLDAGIQPLTP